MYTLTDGDKARLKALLEAEEATLTQELNSVGRKNPTNPADWEAEPPLVDTQPGDIDEVADKIEGYEENTAILKELEARWGTVKLALQKLSSDTYGTCEVSGEPIELERLNANPAARTCIAHKDTELP
jgi:RNA polymerase-binding transcription factor DksA